MPRAAPVTRATRLPGQVCCQRDRSTIRSRPRSSGSPPRIAAATSATIRCSTRWPSSARGAGRVAEHAVGRHRADSAGDERGEERRDRRGVAGLGEVEPDGPGPQVEHQRGLGEAGVGVHLLGGARHPDTSWPSATSWPTAAVSAARLPPCALTKTTRAHHVRSDRVSSTSTWRRASVPIEEVPGTSGARRSRRT